MSTTIQDWLETERQPADVYELLGRLRFDPDRQQLLAAVRSAYAELLPYQNHADPKIAQRAIELQRELGNAESILSNPDKLRALHKTIVNNVRKAYAKAKGGGEDWSRQRLQLWLSQEQRVNATRAEMIASFLLPAAEPPVDFELPQTQAVEPVVGQPTREEERHETEAEVPLARRPVSEVPPAETRPQAKAPVPPEAAPPPLRVGARPPVVKQRLTAVVDVDAAPLPTIRIRKRGMWSPVAAMKAILRNKFFRVAMSAFIVVSAAVLLGMTALYIVPQLKAAKAEGEWSAALAAADKDLLRKYAAQAFDDAKQKATSAKTQAVAGHSGDAARLYREAVVTLNSATSLAIAARNAERAKQDAFAEFETTFRSAAYDRGEELLAEAKAAMEQTRLVDAEQLFGRAAKSFAQAVAAAPAANELGHAQEEWSAALAAADKDLLAKYVPEALHAAQEKAASAATVVTGKELEEATRLYREAIQRLTSATTDALAILKRNVLAAKRAAQDAEKAAATLFQTDARSASFKQGEQLLAEGGNAMKKDNLELAEQLFVRAEKSFAQAGMEVRAANALGKAQNAFFAAEALFETDVRSASSQRGEQLLAEATKAMEKDELELAGELSGQAVKSFAQARVEAPAANALGKAQEARTTAEA